MFVGDGESQEDGDSKADHDETELQGWVDVVGGKLIISVFSFVLVAVLAAVTILRVIVRMLMTATKDFGKYMHSRHIEEDATREQEEDADTVASVPGLSHRLQDGVGHTCGERPDKRYTLVKIRSDIQERV